MVSKKLKPANRPLKAEKPFQLAKFPKAKPKKKASLRNIAPDVTGKRNPVYFNPNNPNHIHGRGIKFHFDPLQPKVRTNPNLDRGTQTLGINTAPSINDVQTQTEHPDINSVQRRSQLVSFGTNTPPRPLHVDNYTMTTTPESRSIGTQPNPSPSVANASTQADYVSPVAPFHWQAAKPRTIDFTPRPLRQLVHSRTQSESMVIDNLSRKALTAPPMGALMTPHGITSAKQPRLIENTPRQPGQQVHSRTQSDVSNSLTIRGQPRRFSYKDLEPKRRMLDPHREDKGRKPEATHKWTATMKPTPNKEPSYHVKKKARALKNAAERPGGTAEGYYNESVYKNYLKKHGLTEKDILTNKQKKGPKK